MPQRRRVRFPDYETQPGAYLVTILTRNHGNLFGDIVKGEMKLNVVGNAIREEWMRNIMHHRDVRMDAYVIMPNHLHGIITFLEASTRLVHTMNELAEVIRRFKLMSKHRFNQISETSGIPLWQAGYYEHAIRDDVDLVSTRDTVAKNPSRWRRDRYFSVR